MQPKKRNTTENVEKFKNLNQDYLTFYHEIRTPQHKFFQDQGDVDENNNFIVISSPSRMGNHLLLSMLDNHPDLPRIPGEDGFLLFCFQQANYDLNRFLTNFLYKRDLSYIKKLSTNLIFDKWFEFKKCHLENKIPEKHSGIEIHKYPSIIDFQDLVFDINYDAYHEVLTNGLEKLSPDASYKEFFCLYLKALLYLDFQYVEGVNAYQGFIVASGMRSQALWLLKNFKNVKILASLRPFGSYALSHIRSRYRIMEIDDALAKEAWEHWYHKVVDYFYLKTLFPENVCLISYDDVILDTQNSAKAIANFLGVDFSEELLVPTIFGIPVKGNSSISRKEKGQYYFSDQTISKKVIPPEYFHLWDSFDLIKTQ